MPQLTGQEISLCKWCQMMTECSNWAPVWRHTTTLAVNRQSLAGKQDCHMHLRLILKIVVGQREEGKAGQQLAITEQS